MQSQEISEYQLLKTVYEKLGYTFYSSEEDVPYILKCESAKVVFNCGPKKNPSLYTYIHDNNDGEDYDELCTLTDFYFFMALAFNHEIVLSYDNGKVQASKNEFKTEFMDKQKVCEAVALAFVHS